MGGGAFRVTNLQTQMVSAQGSNPLTGFGGLGWGGGGTGKGVVDHKDPTLIGYIKLL